MVVFVKLGQVLGDLSSDGSWIIGGPDHIALDRPPPHDSWA